MMIGATNIEEELATIKAILSRLAMESEEKGTQTKHQSEQNSNLTKKLEKQSHETPTKTQIGKSLTGSPTVMMIQMMNTHQKRPILGLSICREILSLITGSVKAQVGKDSCKTHLYTKPYAKMVNALQLSTT